jgi:hypothetical protein
MSPFAAIGQAAAWARGEAGARAEILLNDTSNLENQAEEQS